MNTSRYSLRRICLTSFAAFAALALAHGVASAQTTTLSGSIALRWNDCYGDNGVAARNFACNTNTGSEVLVISATLPISMPQLNGVELRLQVLTTGAAMPNWWGFAAGMCRGTSALGGFYTPPLTSTQCLDTWLGMGSGGVAYTPNYGGPSSALIRTVCAIPGSTTVPANTELFLVRFQLAHTKTTGTGSCTGCLEGACIGLGRVQLTQPLGVGDYYVFDPMPGTTSDVVSWQLGDVVMPSIRYNSSFGPLKEFTGCQSATDAQRPTWGQIKRLYR